MEIWKVGYRTRCPKGGPGYDTGSVQVVTSEFGSMLKVNVEGGTDLSLVTPDIGDSHHSKIILRIWITPTPDRRVVRWVRISGRYS